MVKAYKLYMNTTIKFDQMVGKNGTDKTDYSSEYGWFTKPCKATCTDVCMMDL